MRSIFTPSAQNFFFCGGVGVEVVCSLLCAKEPAAGLYPVSFEFSALIVLLLFKCHFNIIH
jgi:hypothetical protein